MDKVIDEGTLDPPGREGHGSSAARGERKRITRTHRVEVEQLTPGEREELSEEAYAIYAAYKTGVDRASFARQLFAGESPRLALFHGEDGALVGFCSAAIQRVEHEGRRHAVYNALLFIDTRYKGVSETRSFTLLEALRFKLREPWTPLACMGVIMTPASYRRFAVTMPRIYPSRGAPVPASMGALMRETARLRGLSLVDEERWLVRGLGTPRHPERLRNAKSLQADLDAGFYLEKNPRFNEGVSMLIWIPLDLANVCGALARHVAQRLSGGDWPAGR
jgi:hypothetical protein